MGNNQFEPFGEPVAYSLRDMVARDGEQGLGSRLLLRSGVGLFWTLVAAVMVMRVAYFDPDFAEKFGAVASIARYLRSVFA